MPVQTRAMKKRSLEKTNDKSTSVSSKKERENKEIENIENISNADFKSETNIISDKHVGRDNSTEEIKDNEVETFNESSKLTSLLQNEFDNNISTCIRKESCNCMECNATYRSLIRDAKSHIPVKSNLNCAEISPEELMHEQGGRVFLPENMLLRCLAAHDDLKSMIFKIFPFKRKNEIKSEEEDEATQTVYCGAYFTSKAEELLMPKWMFERLNVKEKDVICIELVCCPTLPIASHLTLQPDTEEFLEVDAKKALEDNLKTYGYSALGVGYIVPINHFGVKYECKVVESKPSPIVDLSECDVEIDFELPLETQDYYTRNKTQGTRGEPDYDWEFGILNFSRIETEMKEKPSTEETCKRFPGKGHRLE